MISSTAILEATEGEAYSYTITASDVDGDPLTYSAVEPVPGWLSFNVDTHVLSGTPTNDDVGDNTVTLRVSDSTVDVDQVIVIDVSNTNDAPVFTEDIADQSTDEDADDISFSIIPTDVDTEASLTVTVTTNNGSLFPEETITVSPDCLLYTSDAADE